ncbi:bifunctional DNA primase/polymerase [Nocardiopsis baichengensis]|uniref:hypothetical protein n=1 Tax=Nocardiopsis baichengensis TaxID=280240 RepID=UPI000344D5F0|nr:hypothetical protein [Nocardiopsis baichengensis]
MWDELVRWAAPRGRVRLDTGRRHAYPRGDEAVVGAEPPQVPFAVYLGDAGRMRTVVFDLDAHEGTAEARGRVWADADTLLGLLDEAGLEYYVCRSGPAGGVHVWVPVSGEDGLDEAAAASIGRAARRLLATLDTAPLHADGLVRPPGAPHRDGSRAELIHPTDPADALSIADTEANDAAAFARLAALLCADDERQEDGADGGPGRAVDEAELRLRGRRLPMPDMVRHLLDTPPADGDASAHLARILPRLALARWGLTDVEDLVEAEAGAPGLEHLRTRRAGGGRRRRSGPDAARVLERQWRKAVGYAAQLPSRESVAAVGAGDPELAALAEAVLERVLDGSWWSRQAGPADRRVLQCVLRQVLRSGHREVALDVRRAALETGLGRSTVARALYRLASDGRLELLSRGEGREASTWRLADPAEWPDTRTDQHEHQGGTQGTPPPTGTPRNPSGDPGDSAPEAAEPRAVRSRSDLLAEVTARLDRAAHDVWARTPAGGPQGLGRHAQTTHEALVQLEARGLYTVDTPREELVTALSAATGYTPATTARHLDLLERHGLTTTASAPRAVTGPDALDAAAERLGTDGTGAERAARYAAEQDAWRAWLDELDRLRAPAALTRRAPSGAYPRDERGRPDHTAARARSAQARAA